MHSPVFRKRVNSIGADCYLEPSLSASCKIINRFSNLSIDVAPSYERGVNPFPKDWRMHAFFMDALPILNEKWIDKRSVYINNILISFKCTRYRTFINPFLI
jgi:inosine-uridine nucleoside N-ribohydrolase